MSAKPPRQARQSQLSGYAGLLATRFSNVRLPPQRERHCGVGVGAGVGAGTGLAVGGELVGAADARLGELVGQAVSSDPSLHWGVPSHAADRAKSLMHSRLLQRNSYDRQSPGVSVTVTIDSVGQTMYASSLPSPQLGGTAVGPNANDIRG